MREIIPARIWIGNARDASDVKGILENEIAAIVQLAIEEPPIIYPRELISCRYPLVDGEGNPMGLLRVAIFTVSLHLLAKIPVLVTCGSGMSRSPVIAAAAIASTKNESPDEWLKRIAVTGPHDVSPNLWSEAKNSVDWTFSCPNEPVCEDVDPIPGTV